MKKAILIIAIFLPCLLLATPIKESAEMNFAIKPHTSEIFKSDQVKIDLEFINIGMRKIRLVNLFEPTPVFFSVQLARENGTTIETPGAGKVALNAEPTYVDIAEKKSLVRVFDLSDFLKKNDIVLTPGRYKLQIAYHNQYGQDCIKGWYDSNEIQFTVQH